MLRSQTSLALICSLMLVDQPQLRDLTLKREEPQKPAVPTKGESL